MPKRQTDVWAFKSESNPKKFYQTIRYEDGTLSCNCTGWTRQVARDGSRTCKHCRSVLMGTAAREADFYSSLGWYKSTGMIRPGIEGNQGSQGPQGYTSPGPQGSDGPIGAVGIQGPAGAQLPPQWTQGDYIPPVPRPVEKRQFRPKPKPKTKPSSSQGRLFDFGE